MDHKALINAQNDFKLYLRVIRKTTVTEVKFGQFGLKLEHRFFFQNLTWINENTRPMKYSSKQLEDFRRM